MSAKASVRLNRFPKLTHFASRMSRLAKFSQRWQAVTTSSFDPISANLRFGDGVGTHAFELNYTSGRGTGFVVERKGSAAGTKRPVDDAVSRGIVDQRVDWAAATASDLKSGRAFEFNVNVYDPSLGVSHVLVRLGQVQSARVPARELRFIQPVMK